MRDINYYIKNIKKGGLKTPLVLGLIIIGALMSPRVFDNGYKEITRVDKLAGYIYNNSNNTWEDSHYIATALVSRGGTDVELLASIAKRESDFTIDAVGDSGSALGMFQVQPHHHGPVPSNIFEQVSKARNVLYGFKTKSMNTSTWVARYNGSGEQSLLYARDVLKIRKQLKDM